MMLHFESSSARLKVSNKGQRRVLRRLALRTKGYVWAYDRQGYMQAMAVSYKVTIWRSKWAVTEVDKRPLPKRCTRGKPVMR